MLIGSEPENGRYVAYWLDTFGGRFSEKVFGTRDGHSVRFVFRSSDGLLQNTFIWNVESQTWRWLIEQQDEQGQWLVFAKDSLRLM